MQDRHTRLAYNQALTALLTSVAALGGSNPYNLLHNPDAGQLLDTVGERLDTLVDAYRAFHGTAPAAAQTTVTPIRPAPAGKD